MDFYPDEKSLLNKFDNYDAEIAFVDQEIKRLFHYLDRKGMNSNSLWIITSDHGEGLGNHYYPEHSKKIYNEQLHVPLIFFFSDGRYGPGRIDNLVRHVDILPTLSGLLGYSLKMKVKSVAKDKIKMTLQLYYDSLSPVAPTAAPGRIDPKYIEDLKALGYL